METIIRPKKTFNWSDISELWQYRELMYFFTWRDLKVRYKQTAIGVTWALFQPFTTMVVFSIFFGKFAKMPSDGIPYPIFVTNIDIFPNLPFHLKLISFQPRSFSLFLLFSKKAS